MSRTIFSLLIVFTINCGYLYSQEQACDCEEQLSKIVDYDNILLGKEFHHKYIQKSVQYSANWTFGDIFLSNGVVIKNQQLRYSMLTDELLWMRTGNAYVSVLDRKSIAGFLLYSRTDASIIKFEKVNHKNIQLPENGNMYLQVLVKGKVSLFKKLEITENNSDGSLERRDIYFLFKDGEYKSFKPYRWRLYDIFGEDEQEIKHIIRSNHLSTKKEWELIKAIELFNSGQ